MVITNNYAFLYTYIFIYVYEYTFYCSNHATWALNATAVAETNSAHHVRLYVLNVTFYCYCNMSQLL